MTAAAGGTIKVKLAVTAGQLSITGVVSGAGPRRHGHREPLVYGSATTSRASPATLTIRITPSGAARNALARAKRLRVTMRIKLTAPNRATITKTVTVTVRATRRHH